MINLVRAFATLVMLAGCWPLLALASDPASTMADLKEQYRRPTSIPFPPENPFSDAKGQLGRILFFDPIMSGPRTIACSSCHNPGLSWTDGQTLASGVGKMRLHSPTIIDVAWVRPVLGWDGKFKTLEGVAFGPLISPINMSNTEPEDRPLGLTATEKQDLVAFLKTLTGEPTPIEAPVLPR